MSLEKKILVIIPAYNEEKSIARVIQGVGQHIPESDILVVNDGSTDQTSQKANKTKAVVLNLPINLGIGGAMQSGYRYAYEKGYEIAIQVDGDGQHDPKEIPKLLETLRKMDVDMVNGSRFIGQAGYRPSAMRLVGISILSNMILLITGQRITDPTSGFRAVNRKAIRLFALHYPQDYPEPEALVLISRCGLKMGEVSVSMNQRYFGESSITKIRSVYYMVKVFLAIFVDCFKKADPLGEERGKC